MIRVPYFIGTLIVGLFLHVLCVRYLTVHGVGPDMLLLLTVAHGFLFGPLAGELIGFSFGLVADATGSSLFGMNALLLVLAGYVSGSLRRRVASERPTSQIIIGLTATVFAATLGAIVSSSFEGGPSRVSAWAVVFESILNALITPIVFMAVETWADIWSERAEHV